MKSVKLIPAGKNTARRRSHVCEPLCHFIKIDYQVIENLKIGFNLIDAVMMWVNSSSYAQCHLNDLRPVLFWYDQIGLTTIQTILGPKKTPIKTKYQLTLSTIWSTLHQTHVRFAIKIPDHCKHRTTLAYIRLASSIEAYIFLFLCWLAAPNFYTARAPSTKINEAGWRSHDEPRGVSDNLPYPLSLFTAPLKPARV